MIRGYAIALGAGTQVFTNLPWPLVPGPPSVLSRAFLMGAGWAINLVFAEWLIRRPNRVRRAGTPNGAGQNGSRTKENTRARALEAATQARLSDHRPV